MNRPENLLNANTFYFGEIISGDNIYNIPLYQRDYSWKTENLDDLWQDIINARDGQTRHYMGSIVLIKKDKKNFEIIDGQQRITTLSLLVLSAIKIVDDLINSDIDKEDNLERKDILMTKYLAYKSPKSLMFAPKLKLNKLNDPIYSSYLIQFDKVPNIKKEPLSNRLLYDAFNYFYKKIKEEVYVDGSTEEIVDFLDFVGDNLQFIQITVVDELNAYLVFETLNDRGIPLTVTDLFKNYLFSLVAPADHDHIKNKWDNILKYIKYKDFSSFLRYYWISRNKLITEKELFKAIKSSVSDQKEVFDIVSKLEGHAEVFTALSDPNDELWKGEDELIQYLSELQLFGIKQPFPLLLAAYEKLDITTFTKIAKICSIISFRYTVISGSKTNVLEQVYSRAANNISKGISKSAKDVFKDVSQLYLNDEVFTSNFISKSIKTNKNKLVRYIIYSIENHLAPSSRHYEKDNGTIEHILPENPTKEWNTYFSKDIQNDYIYRLGNYTLLERKLNKQCENKLLTDKLDFYSKSEFLLSNKFNYSEWNPNKVRIRQGEMAKVAKQIWRLNY